MLDPHHNKNLVIGSNLLGKRFSGVEGLFVLLVKPDLNDSLVVGLDQWSVVAWK